MHSFPFPLFWLPLLPFLGALVLFLFGKHLRKGTIALLACGVVGGAALLATQAVIQLASLPTPSATLSFSFFSGASWMPIPVQWKSSFQAGFALDRLSAVLVLVITWIGLFIHIYASSYMQEEKNYSRFFAYLNLFMGSMLVLVLGDSMPLTFVGWEGVGLCSYLLIGFWYTDENNASAGRKAFVVNRIGDFGFLVAMGLLFSVTGSLHYDSLSDAIAKLNQPFWFGWPASYFVALFLFIGCAGKSAQLPLYIWLPDAMAGPTPVSALIHAATMVTAGVYMVARTHVIFDMALPPTAKMVVASVGALTALFAATIGLVQRDFKKVLAYSTVSQLGFMFVGVGTGAYAAGFFHLVTHAFFKAGLFLGAGSVMHAMHGEGDISKMGGLRKKMPITHATFLVYFLAIAGIFPFSGFFSKDGILLAAWDAHFAVNPTAAPWIQSFAAHILPKCLWGALIAAALCTAFYMGRLYFLVFHGKFRGTPEQASHLHESPASMTIPLILLAVGSIAAGVLGLPGPFAHDGPWHEALAHWLGTWSSTHGSPSIKMEIYLMVLASLVSVLGIHLSYMLYRNGFSPASISIARKMKPLYALLWKKYFVDELYHAAVVRPIVALSKVLYWVDSKIVDRIFVQGWGTVTNALSKALRHAHNGNIQRYMALSLMAMAAIWYFSTSDLVQKWELRNIADFQVVFSNGKARIDKKGTLPVFVRISWEGENIEEQPFAPMRATTEHVYQTRGKHLIVLEVCDRLPSSDSLEAACQRSDRLWFPGSHAVDILNDTKMMEEQR